MKKIILVLGLIVLSLVLVGCMNAEKCVDICLKQDGIVESYNDHTCTCYFKEDKNCEQETPQTTEGEITFGINSTTNNTQILWANSELVYLPKIMVDCDSIIKSYQNESENIVDLIGILSIWGFKCLELTREQLLSMNESLTEVYFRIIKDDICYGYCEKLTQQRKR